MKPTTIKHLAGFVYGVGVGRSHVIKFHQGRLSCDCPGWRFHGRNCRHAIIFHNHHTDNQAKLLSVSGKAAYLTPWFPFSVYNTYQSQIVEKVEIVKRHPEYFKAEEIKKD